MSIAAINTRNQFKGIIVAINRGDIVSEIEIETAAGIHAVVCEAMAGAARVHLIEKGRDLVFLSVSSRSHTWNDDEKVVPQIPSQLFSLKSRGDHAVTAE